VQQAGACAFTGAVALRSASGQDHLFQQVKMGIDSANEAQMLVAAAGAGAAKAQEGLEGPKPEHGEHGGSGSGSSPSTCDEPVGDHGVNSVNPSPRLPCSATDEEEERDAEEQAAIASIILQLSQQPPATKRRRVRNPPGGAHADHHEAAGGKHGSGGADTEVRRSRGGGQASGGKGSRPVSQPPTPQPPPSTPSGGLPGLPSFAHFPDPVRRHNLPGSGGGPYQMPPLPQLSLSDSAQSNTLPAIVSSKEVMHTHLPPPPDGIFHSQHSVGTPASQHMSLHPFPGALAGIPTSKGRTSGGLTNGGNDGNDQMGSGQHHGGNSSHEPGASEGGDGAELSGSGGAAGGNKTTEVRRPYRCSKCGAEKKGHLCSAKLAANMMPATPIKRVDLAARLAARLQSGAGDGSDGMEVDSRGLQPNDLSNLPFFRSFRAEEVYGEAVMNHPALAAGVPVLMKCPPGAWEKRLSSVSQMGS
jgi:hypothetical protein